MATSLPKVWDFMKKRGKKENAPIIREPNIRKRNYKYGIQLNHEICQWADDVPDWQWSISLKAVEVHGKAQPCLLHESKA